MHMKIYYTLRELSGEEAVRAALQREGLPSFELRRSEHGKPYLFGEGAPKIGVAHTKGLTAVALSPVEVGLDVERREERTFPSYLRRLTDREREEDFFVLWTAKEAYIKYRGETLSSLLLRLRFEKERLLLDGAPLSEDFAFFELSGCLFCVCTAEREAVELLPF